MHSKAAYTRAGRDDQYWWVPGATQELAFRPGYVHHIREYDPAQDIYGQPEWLSALQSGLLNEAATIFRRRYYINGSHAGYILYINDAKFDAADSDELEAAVEKSKGPGNFRNVYLHIPGGHEKGVQVIPVGEAAAKDEFVNIKGATMEDVLAAHRVPPLLIGVVAKVAGGFGKPTEAADVFHWSEIEPLQQRFLSINDWLGLDAVAFDPYQPMAGRVPAAA